MTDETQRAVSWYNCDCDWITKFCDENHKSYALVPVLILEQYKTR